MKKKLLILLISFLFFYKVAHISAAMDTRYDTNKSLLPVQEEEEASDEEIAILTSNLVQKCKVKKPKKKRLQRRRPCPSTVMTRTKPRKINFLEQKKRVDSPMPREEQIKAAQKNSLQLLEIQMNNISTQKNCDDFKNFWEKQKTEICNHHLEGTNKN